MKSRIKMHRCTDVKDLEVGDFWWTDLGWKPGCDSARLHVAMPPSPGLRAKYCIMWVPCSTTGGDKDGDRFWNGNWDKPTVAGSWGGMAWFHPYVEAGYLVEE